MFSHVRSPSLSLWLLIICVHHLSLLVMDVHMYQICVCFCVLITKPESTQSPKNLFGQQTVGMIFSHTPKPNSACSVSIIYFHLCFIHVATSTTSLAGILKTHILHCAPQPPHKAFWKTVLFIMAHINLNLSFSVV